MIDNGSAVDRSSDTYQTNSVMKETRTRIDSPPIKESLSHALNTHKNTHMHLCLGCHIILDLIRPKEFN